MSAASRPVVISFKGTVPKWTAAEFGKGATLVGRVSLGENVSLAPWVALRGDGNFIEIGNNCQFLDRATVHIADGMYPTKMGRNITVGRFALVHACTVADDCVLGDAAVVMDNSLIGAGTVIAAGTLVPPGKTLEGGWLYSGNPARPVREIFRNERETLRAALLSGEASKVVCEPDLPPLDMTLFVPTDGGLGPLYSLNGARPRIDPRGYVAPTSVVAGDVVTEADTSIWFSTIMSGEGAPIRLGSRSNVQDNSILVTNGDRGPILIGADVTVGHNVRLGACRIGDNCLIGMGAQVGDGVVVEDGALVGARAYVEPGTVVKSGHIWAGRPAGNFRPVKSEEYEFFQRGKDVYVGYANTYLTEQLSRSDMTAP